MKKPLIKAILFDWDLTLAHTIGVGNSDERLTMLFQQQGLPYTLPEMQEAQSRRAAVQTVVPVLTIVPQTKQAIKENYAALLTELQHPFVEDSLLEELYYGFAELPTALYADVTPTVLQLQAAGYELGIITNHTASVRPTIQRMVGDYFPAHTITISEEEDVYKPNGEIFQTAAARLGVAPEECVFVGDNKWVDAVGAVEQGGFQQGFWLNREGESLHSPLPDCVRMMTGLQDIFSLV